MPAAGRCSLKCHTLRANERQGVDKASAAFFHHQRSGAPVALIGLKGNPVRPAIAVASQIRSCPRNCRRRVPLQVATGLCAPKLGKAEKDDDPRARRPAWTTSSFRRAGRAHGAVFRCGDRGELSSGPGSTAMRCHVQRFTIIGRAAIAKLARVTWTAAFLAAAPAMAADVSMPKASWQPPVVQAYDWTGLYVGAHLGYAWGHSNWSAPPGLASSLDLFQSSDVFTGAGSYFGGLQIGYDYMLANRVVLGAQIDTSFPGFPRKNISIGGVSIFSTPDIGLASYSENVLHFGTLRGRVGYALDNWLFYATGGFAWTYDQLTLTQLTDGTTDAPFLWRLGWVAGLGVEWAFAPNWSANVEYLYTRYRNSSVMFPNAGLQFTSDFSLQQVRAGLNYHGQTTFVWQGYPAFRSPFAGTFSLPGSGLGRETFDATLYAGLRLWQGAELWIAPEIDQGFGFANTHGVAGFPTGESYKLGSSYPYVRMHRGFLRQTINLGGEVEKVDADISQFAGTRTENRLVLTIGKFAIVDIFDTNKYANSPKTDFLNWALINAGTFDYA